MKKTYKAPLSSAVRLTWEGMMAQSLQIGGDSKVTEESQVLSNGQGWSSDNWSCTDDEE